MPGRHCFLFLLLVMLPLSLKASSQIFIFGGGSTAVDSQVSIELNTRWIKGIIQDQHPERPIYLHYTDGNDAGLDVRSRLPAEKAESRRYQPLARVFGSEIENGYLYYSSNISENVKPSDASSITGSLHNIFTNSRPGDELLLIYQGHGGYSSDTNKNHFRLWDGSKINVTELETLLSQVNQDVTLRFVFPQCFSGAFTRLIYDGAEVEKGIAKGRRCGFVAQRQDRESEGCTDSVNTSDYRDYSSYFFSAIDGKGIDGSSLAENPDRNNDGDVSLLEAHYYTLRNAYSVDFSRSTSQDYLEQWQPWYLRWIPTPRNPDNIYSEIAEYIADRFKLMGKGNNVISDVSDRLATLRDVIERLEKEQIGMGREIDKIQKHIKSELSKRWPSILNPYTEQFSKLMLENIDDIEVVIRANPGYQKLVVGQARSANISKELLEANRDFVQMQKILWMRKLARIFDQFQRYASDHDKQEYEKLVQCEDAPL